MEVDPLAHIENAAAVLVDGRWPNFHDAEIDELLFRTGDIRPEEGVWTGASLAVRLTLWAERRPPVLRLHFADCEGIAFAVGGAQNDIHDLEIAREPRGFLRDGVTPLTPWFVVRFLSSGPAAASLEFRCVAIRAETLGELPDNAGARTLPFG